MNTGKKQKTDRKISIKSIKATKKPIIPSYLQGYSSSQLEIIMSDHSVKQVVAGAGSGKTRTVIGLLIYRLKEHLEKPHKVLLLSFSRKAVKELRERLPEELRNLVEISTFHAFCLSQLRLAYPRSLAKLKIASNEIKEKFFYHFLSQADYLTDIGGLPIPLLLEHPQNFARILPDLYLKVNEAYKNYKKKERLFEFEDLIDIMLRSLRKKKKASTYIEKMRRAYDLIIIDEFQDTDPRQLEFFQLMNAKRKVVVGDDWQAIYGFRGASVKPFLDFKQIFAAKVMYLSDNYRSLSNIVRLGTKVIRASSKQIKKKINAVRKNKNHLAILKLKLERESIASFSNKLIKQDNLEYMILVRTNWQKNFWIRMGIAEQRVSTIHKSKGLEFPIVFVDMSAAWTRHKTKKKKKNLNMPNLAWLKDQELSQADDEEIRILYVAVSRAMNLLFILHSPPESAGLKESYYCEKLLLPNAQECSIEEMPNWLEKESLFRKAS